MRIFSEERHGHVPVATLAAVAARVTDVAAAEAAKVAVALAHRTAEARQKVWLCKGKFE